MKPIDICTANFSDMQARLAGDRSTVLAALRQHGPCTTRELATAMHMDILSVRPRVTELCDIGFAEMVAYVKNQKREGVYAAFSDEAARAWLLARQDAMHPTLPL
jgi:predicted transcriptional regulator